MTRTITLRGETYEAPGYDLGAQVEVHHAYSDAAARKVLGWLPGVVIGVSLNHVRVWLDGPGARQIDLAPRDVRPRSAIDRLGELA